MKKYLDFLYEKENDILELIGRFVEIESPTLDKGKTDYFATVLRDVFEQYTGGRVEVAADEHYGNHIKGVFGEGKEQVLIVGHYDTVHPAGTLKHFPFKVEKGKAWGPGVYDMKGGLAQGIFALMAIKEMGVKLNKKIVCLFNSDEEIGSVSSRYLLIEEALKSKCAFVLEPSFGAEGAIKIGRKGVGTYKLSVEGKAAHAGNCPEEGVNAIEEICRHVLDLQTLNDNSSGVTVNCGLIRGGKTKNTVPDGAELTIDVRALKVADCKNIHKRIYGLAPYNPLAKLYVEGSFTRLPMEVTSDSEALYSLAKGLMYDNCNTFLPKAIVGGASDGNITSAFVPTLDGLGCVGDNAHSLEEYIYPEHLLARTALLAALIEYC